MVNDETAQRSTFTRHSSSSKSSSSSATDSDSESDMDKPDFENPFFSDDESDIDI